MTTSEDPQSRGEVKFSSKESHEPQENKPNNQKSKAPVADSGSTSTTSCENRKVSHEDIELVQNLIERCLQLYMNRGEVVKTLLNRARIEPGFTSLVWQKLEEENPEFFKAYYIRLKLKKQIILFNTLLEHQYRMMKYNFPPNIPMAPMQNGVLHRPANNLPMGYPVMQQPSMPVPRQPHVDSMKHGMSTCHVVNGVPVPGNFRHLRKSGNQSMMNGGASDAGPPLPPSSVMSSKSEVAASSPSVASKGHFSFTQSEISGMGVDASALGTAFVSDLVGSERLQFGVDVRDGSSNDNFPSLEQIAWDFGLSDLTVELTNLEDIGILENYTGSPFLPSDPDLLLDSPEDDHLVNEYFVDSVGAPREKLGEEKS